MHAPLIMALPKGRILAECFPLLAKAGLVPADDLVDEDSRRLRFPTNDPMLDVVRVRPFDVATFVAYGAAQIGICGADVLMEFDYPEIYAPLDLGIGACRVSVAAPFDEEPDDPARWSTIRVATKYPNIARRHYAARGIHADVVHLNGAMELAPGLGLSRLIVDLVQTGSTLKANGLRETEVIAHVTSRLIVNRTALKTRPEEVGAWLAPFPRRRRSLVAGKSQQTMKRLDTRQPGFEAKFEALLDEARETTASVDGVVSAIIAEVRAHGDDALCRYTERFDRVALTAATLRVTQDEIDAATASIAPDLLTALDLAATRIEAFHRAQLPVDMQMHDDAGVTMGMRWTPLDSAGLYVPGGKAAYPSSVLMNAIPARVAGVGRVAMCVPCPGGVLNPLVLAAAKRAGVSKIFRVGGAQAIAALAFGTASIAAVDRIVGPGNAYVAEAKRQVFGRVGIDGVAGPSEVVILADASNDPRHVAIDLLAQAEHDEAAQSILITDDAEFAAKVEAAVEHELLSLSRAAIAGASWRDHGAVILVRDWAEAASLTDRLAPEHLQIMVPEPAELFANIRHAGAAFLGRFVPEALGDYIAGPNHVLPTGRTARFASGLSVFDFLKRTTWINTERGRARGNRSGRRAFGRG